MTDTGEFILLEPDRDEYVDVTVFGHAVSEPIGTGEFLMLEPDRDEFRDTTVYGHAVEPVIVPAGGISREKKVTFIDKETIQAVEGLKILVPYEKSVGFEFNLSQLLELYEKLKALKIEIPTQIHVLLAQIQQAHLQTKGVMKLKIKKSKILHIDGSVIKQKLLTHLKSKGKLRKMKKIREFLELLGENEDVV